MKPFRFTLQSSLIILLSALLCEGGLRAFHLINPHALFLQWPNYDHFRAKPHARDYGFQLNSRGYKDLEFSARKQSGARRVAALGDSCAFGAVPYAQNFLTVLEAEWGAEGSAAEARIEVLNFGIPGIGPPHYTSLLLNEVLPLKPDLILLNFFSGNDFYQADEDFWQPRMQSFLLQTLRFLKRAVTELDGKIIHPLADYADDQPVYSEAAYLEIEVSRASIYRQSEVKWPELLDKSLQHMRKFKALCDLHGIELAVVIIPDELQLNSELQQQVQQQLAADPSDFDYSRPNTEFKAGLTELGIEALDLLPAFRSRAANERLYRVRDSHWNVSGNRLAAEVMRDFLKSKFFPGGEKRDR